MDDFDAVTHVVPPALPDAPGLLLLQDGREAWAASGPTQGLWEALASFARAQYMTTDQQQAMHAIEQAVLGRPMPWNATAATPPPSPDAWADQRVKDR